MAIFSKSCGGVEGGNRPQGPGSKNREGCPSEPSSPTAPTLLPCALNYCLMHTRSRAGPDPPRAYCTKDG